MAIAQAAEGTRHLQKSFTFLSQLALGRLSSPRERCSLLARNLPEVKEKHWFSTSSETIRGCPLGDGKRGSRGCQDRARLRK